MDDGQSLKIGKQFEFQSEVYTGPLDLLIDLIERRKLLVNDISLTSVTDDYMKYVAELEHHPLRDIADFVVLAATLLLLKSKSLLPILELTDEEEESVDALEARLRYFQIFRTASQKLMAIFGKTRLHDRPYVQDRTPMFLPDRYTEKTALGEAIARVVANLPKKVEKPKVQVKKVISLEDMIANLKERIEKQFTLKFKEFTGDSKERTTIIVGFLAVLEMVKQGMVMVTQSDRFEEIHIERQGASTPKYFS